MLTGMAVHSFSVDHFAGAATGLQLQLTPNGRVLAQADPESAPLAGELAARISRDFAAGSGPGLLGLGAREVGTTLPASLAWWRDFAARFVAATCGSPDSAELPAPAAEELAIIAQSAPPMPGAEYLSVKVLRGLWGEIGAAFHAQRSAARASVADYLKSLNEAWHLVGRVHFNLAENRKDESFPFAFLATYTHKLASHGKAQHLPLGQALSEYAGAGNKARLLSLLEPVQRAAQSCPWLKAMVDKGEIFHPLRWSASEAFSMLRDAPKLEQAGLVVRMPANWKGGRPSRPQVMATVGAKQPSTLGIEQLLDFNMGVTLDGSPLSESELRRILEQSDGLALVRGQWVEVDRERLKAALAHYRQAEGLTRKQGLTFAEAMRMLAGADIGAAENETTVDRVWSQVAAGPWLAQTLASLRDPKASGGAALHDGLKAALRPYQQSGVRWLRLLCALGLGACLADDMGLGKTLQFIALLLARRRERGSSKPSLLVAPASLLANWLAEAERFSPTLKLYVAHPSFVPTEELKKFDAAKHSSLDLVLTSYGALLRLPKLQAATWDIVALDEAQAIKNPGAKQTRAVKGLRAAAKVALTGTPVENKLGDLWSIFDFINPGLLGSAKAFSSYARRLAEGPSGSYAPLRELIRPYILRRLKTDKSVISDLPEKTEVKAYCALARKQAALYQQAVDDLAEKLSVLSGIERRGVVLAFLMRFKQICNHPSQWLGDGAWGEAESGKFQRLRELTETIAAKQEKALIFTQFKETIAPLAAFLGRVFGRDGLVLHGETPVAKRRELVKRFQDDESIPFFILSLKAGGSGLNLTAASHVIHFDRWWNPAVENQATDRAFRIGQKRNVLVHKLISRGTVEQKIDDLIESKKKLSGELLEGGAEINLTEIKDDELLKLVSLDLSAAIKD